jgi:GTP cyclohydrolase IIa
MIQLTIIRIEGYGPWTLTLGSDREAQLQMLQARIYYDVQRLFSELGALVFFNRFDEYFAISNGLGYTQHVAIQQELSRLYPALKTSMTVGSGKTALQANMAAYEARKQAKPQSEGWKIFGLADNDHTLDSKVGQGSVQIMHIDVDSSTKVGATLSPFEVTLLVMRVYSKLAQEFLKLKSLAFFLGGDNVMVVSNGVTASDAESIIKRVSSDVGIKFNCGIGIGANGRKAAEAATKALDTIRELRDQGKITPIYEIRCP